MAVPDQLLVVVDPAARRIDGESVRIAQDVLGAGADSKICLPGSAEDFARALTRRGTRRPVVIGDDHALRRAVDVLLRERDPRTHRTPVLGLIPVGAALTLAGRLGVPTAAVQAARTVLDGGERRLGLLSDDSGGLVLGDLHIPAQPGAEAAATVPPQAGPAEDESLPGHPLLRTCQSLVRTLTRPSRGAAAGAVTRLRVEADGRTLVDLDRPVRELTLTPCGGFADVRVDAGQGREREALSARARTVTVSGPDFRYAADARTTGPVRTRTWTAHAEAWALTLPAERADPAEPTGTGTWAAGG